MICSKEQRAEVLSACDAGQRAANTAGATYPSELCGLAVLLSSFHIALRLRAAARLSKPPARGTRRPAGGGSSRHAS